MKKKLCLILAFICQIFLVNATNYFCSPEGKGDGKSYNNPTTFQKGVSSISHPGDTLFLLGGQYNLSATFAIQSKHGTEAQNIVIMSYYGEYAIIDFRKQPYDKRGIEVKSCTYLTIKNLAIRYAGKNGLWNSSNYCTFEFLDVYGNSDSGIQMKGGSYNRIINCDSHDNFDYKLDKSGNLTQVDFGGNADGFADKQFSGAGNYYYGCRAWNNSDDGWDCYERITTDKPTVIENCICYHNGPTSYNMVNHARYEIDKAWFDQFRNGKEVKTVDKERIIVTLENYTNQGNANGFKLGGNYTKHEVFVNHCLAAANIAKGFDQNNNAGSMTIYNCTGSHNNTDFSINNGSYGTLTIRNSLTYKGSLKIGCKTVLANDYNSWNLPVKVEDNDFVSLDTATILAPRQADGSLPIIEYMHLVNGSDLVDKGIDLGMEYTGKAPDLGCFEIGKENITAPEELIEGKIINKDEIELEPKNKNGHKIAFITLTEFEADKKIILQLRENPDFSVWIEDATKANDYSDYEVIVLSPVPNSANIVDVNVLKEIDKPFLLLKPFMVKSSAWNWASAYNSPLASMTITQPEHPIFENLSNQEELTLYSAVNSNGIAYVQDWNYKEFTTLATVYENDPAILECDNILMIGLSEYSSANITDDGLQLITNSIYYLLQGTIKDNLENINTITTKSGIYDVLGRFYGNDETNLPHGFYIINGKKHIR